MTWPVVVDALLRHSLRREGGSSCRVSWVIYAAYLHARATPSISASPQPGWR